ncbi:hypothetical protein [Streptomyces xanthophaeus]
MPPTGASSPGSPPRWRTCWRGPLRRARWRRNCAAARGAAVEDAAVLARRLDATPGTASAFRAYEAERRAGVRRIQNQALRMNQLARLPAGPLSSLRDLAMASLPGPAERFAVRRMFDGPPAVTLARAPRPVRYAKVGPLWCTADRPAAGANRTAGEGPPLWRSNWLGVQAGPVLPARVADGIRSALDAGWRPESPGSPFLLDRSAGFEGAG